MTGMTSCRPALQLFPPALALLASGHAAPASAQNDVTRPQVEIYGFAQADLGYDFGQNDPDWFDVNRPTKLPAFDDEFGRDGRTYVSVRQSQFGVRSTVPTSRGDLNATFEVDMFGVGDDAGETTIRLRLAYGQLGDFGGGQIWSPFMDVDVFPNTLDYWGPNGMLFFRNVMAFWQPIQGDSRLTVALERPGATGDEGVFEDRIELEGVELRFPRPDLSAEYRRATPWGYVEIAGILRYIRYDDLVDDAVDLGGSTTGWGLSLSSNVMPNDDDVLRLQLVYGEGIESYFNDAPIDVAAETDPARPAGIDGTALPALGFTAFLDHTWNERWTSTIGYSLVDIDNSDGQAPDAFKRGQYALTNIQYHPTPQVMMGAELQWAQRENFSDGFSVDDFRVQFSLRYRFSFELGGGT